MKPLKSLLLVFILLSVFKPCLADFSYHLEYVNYPVAGQGIYDGVPAARIMARLKFGELPCQSLYPDECYLPEYLVGVGLWWVDLGSIPLCEQLMFYSETLVHSFYEKWDNGPWLRRGSFGHSYHCGEGFVKPLHRRNCHMGVFRSGWNYFDVEVGPLCPGDYIMRLYTFSWPMDIKISENCDPMDPELGPSEYLDVRKRKIVAENLIHVPFSCVDPMRIIDVIAIDDGSADPEAYFDTVYAGGTLSLNHRYWLATHLRTDMFEELVPNYLKGLLTPEGSGSHGDNPIIFNRWTEGDLGCDDAVMHDYAYMTEDTFRPLNLWNLTPEEWSGNWRILSCIAYASEDGTGHSLESRFYVTADVALDCLNDTTRCFVPANEEEIDFRFIYSAETGLDENSEVTFYVTDRGGSLVYSTPIQLVNWHDDDDDLPRLPAHYSVSISWDGRDNQEADGHLVDPESGPYHAQVIARVPGPLLTDLFTNVEDFYVVPKIDSILLTHTPSYPPPGAGETTTLYAIIRGKIDDSSSPINNYRYYHTPDIMAPNVLGAWDGERTSRYFHDLPTGAPEEPPQNPNQWYQQYYYENNMAEPLNLREWNDYMWGAVRYDWKVYHDKRVLENGKKKILYDVIDTSSSWGTNWKVSLTAPDNWCHGDLMPYMRLLSGVSLSNRRNSFMVQTRTSAKNENAHKVIFGDNPYYPGYSIVDWAKTHIGVAYEATYGYNKMPYRKIECSGLVTATRVQDIGSENNDTYRIAWILANDYKRGHYDFRGEEIDLEVENIPITDVENGCLITLTPTSAGPNGPAEHIVIVDYVELDETYRKFRVCDIVHARGGYDEYGRVRYENFVTTYQNSGDYYFKYLRWAQ